MQTSPEYELSDNFLKSICPRPTGTSISPVYVNNKENLLDIIIPCFNAGKYIVECLDRLLHKIPTHIRIIVVNDGSTDDTSDILQNYDAMPEVTVINQPNGGAAGARNTALKQLNAEYVTFVDADDCINIESLIFMLNVMQSGDYDVVECELTRDSSSFSSESASIISSECQDTSSQAYASRIFAAGYICGKIYDSDIWQGIMFPEGCWFEDTILKLILEPRCRSIGHIPKPLYYYRPNEDGCTEQAADNIRSVESYWITENLFNDYIKAAYPVTRDIYDEFLSQIVLNFVRTNNLGREVNTAVFYKSCELLGRIREYAGFTDAMHIPKRFSAYSHNKYLNALEYSLVTKDYNTYLELCPLAWKYRLIGEVKSPMNVAIAINRKFLKYAVVFCTSLFENHPSRNINLYILYSDIPQADLSVFEDLEKKYDQMICCQEITRDDLPEGLPENDYWPIEIYFRLFLPMIIPECEDRVLYLDTDVIINKNIEELYDEDFQDFTLIACRDTSVATGGLTETQIRYLSSLSADPAKDYFNSGVLLMNLSRIRSMGGSAMLFEKLTEDKDKVFAPDQDLLNFLFYNDVKFEDSRKYNCFARDAFNSGITCDDLRAGTSIIHYAGRKPWTGEAIRYDSELIWWEYARKTEFYTELLEEVLLGEIRSNFINDQIRSLNQEKNELMSMLLKFKELI